MFTITKLAKQFGLSRSTLLYYDKIGLLHASERSQANYRKYSEKNRLRLQQICKYREAGINLEDIKKILDSSESSTASILEKRLDELNREIRKLRNQQHVIARLLQNKNMLRKISVMNKEQWVKLLQASGLNREARDRWHKEFEKISPDAHQEFLESLGIPTQEINSIRDWASKN